eukprot:6648363-Prymnesium_polylepis.1
MAYREQLSMAAMRARINDAGSDRATARWLDDAARELTVRYVSIASKCQVACHDVATECYHHALFCAQRVDDTPSMAECLYHLGTLSLERGRTVAAVRYLSRIVYDMHTGELYKARRMDETLAIDARLRARVRLVTALNRVGQPTKALELNRVTWTMLAHATSSGRRRPRPGAQAAGASYASGSSLPSGLSASGGFERPRSAGGMLRGGGAAGSAAQGGGAL